MNLFFIYRIDVYYLNIILIVGGLILFYVEKDLNFYLSFYSLYFIC